MYADRYARSGGIKPGSLSVAIGINAAILGALLLSAPVVTGRIGTRTLETTNIPIDPPPPPEPAPPQPQAKPHQQTIASPQQPDTTHAIKPIADGGFVLPPQPPFQPGAGSIGGGTIIDLPMSLPVLTNAQVDPRYASAFQPDYPAGERRAEMEGKVTIRVLIGIDGRVKQAERVAAASDAFWRATERQALSRWRFRPATRDGVAVEAWRTMTVRFEIAP